VTRNTGPWKTSTSLAFRNYSKETTHTQMRAELNNVKAKLAELQHRKLQAIILHTDQADRIEGETPSLYNVLQLKRRREERTMTALQEEGGEIQTTPAGIARTMKNYLKNVYNTIPVDKDSILPHATLRRN
jgi:hypothetical protein